MEGLLGGLVVGKISDWRISPRLIYSMLLLLITTVFFNAFSV